MHHHIKLDISPVIWVQPSPEPSPHPSSLPLTRYVYYDFKLDIVAINAIVLEENEHATSAINLGEPSEFPHLAIEPM